MGWMSSWIGVQGAAKAAVLDGLGLVEVGGEVEPGSGRAAFGCGELPGGWVIVFSEDFEWADRERLLEASRLGLAIACQFEDKVEMTSVASVAQDGVELWRVFHKNDPYGRLDVSGEPPAEFAGIRDQLFREQEEDGGEDSPADYLHDIPLELAKSVCGYRADESEAVFVALKRIGAAAAAKPAASGLAEPRPKRSFLARLLGR